MSDWNVPVVSGKGELQTAKQSTGALGRIQSAYTMALMSPRNEDAARLKILARAKDPQFAERALYSRPVGNGKVASGPAIGSAKALHQIWKNLLVEGGIVHDDDEKLIIYRTAIDLENNATETMEGIVRKIVERKDCKNREVLYQRETSVGAVVFGVRAFDHEIELAAASLGAKLKRNCILALIPSDIIDEFVRQCEATISGEAESDPIAARKAMVSAFLELGVRPEQLVQFLGHKLEELTPPEVALLRGHYNAVKQGDTTWDDIAGSHRPAPAKASLDLSDVFPGDPDTHSEPTEPMTQQVKKGRPKKVEIEVPAIDWAVCADILKNKGSDEKGISWAHSLALGRYGVEDIADITKEQSRDFKAWFEKDLIKELTQENFLPMILSGGE